MGDVAKRSKNRDEQPTPPGYISPTVEKRIDGCAKRDRTQQGHLDRQHVGNAFILVSSRRCFIEALFSSELPPKKDPIGEPQSRDKDDHDDVGNKKPKQFQVHQRHRNTERDRDVSGCLW